MSEVEPQDTLILQQNNKKRKISKNIRLNPRRSPIKRMESNRFNDPIYQGLEQQAFNKQEHQFGPWVGQQHKISRQHTSQIRKRVKKVEKPILKNSQSEPKIQKSFEPRNWEDTLRMRFVPLTLDPEKRQQRLALFMHPKQSLPQISDKTKEHSPPIQSIHEMRFSSTEMYRDLGQLSPEIKELKAKKLFKLKVPESKGQNYKTKLMKQIPLQNVNSSNTENKSKISKVIYNYCYDDDLFSARLNPEIQKASQAQIRQQLMNRMKMEMVKKSLKNDRPKPIDKQHRNEKLLSLIYKKKY